MTGAPSTIRRPVRGNTGLVRAVLDRLETTGVEWAPKFVGVDSGEEILTWLPGAVIENWWDRPALLDELTHRIRQLHDATEDLSPGSECCVHNDLQPRNIVVHDGRVGVIDWEQLRHGRRVEDVAQICWSFVGGSEGRSVDEVGGRWRRVLDTYGLIDRRDLVDAAMAKIATCVEDITDGASDGSQRHQLLAERGDHHDLQRQLAWIETNAGPLRSLVG